MYEPPHAPYSAERPAPPWLGASFVVGATPPPAAHSIRTWGEIG
jgi:hypothetical protein